MTDLPLTDRRFEPEYSYASPRPAILKGIETLAQHDAHIGQYNNTYKRSDYRKIYDDAYDEYCNSCAEEHLKEGEGHDGEDTYTY